METNEVLAGIRYSLHLKNAEVKDLIASGGGSVTPFEVVDMLKKDEEAGYLICTPERLHQFFDGLIIKRRGPRDGAAPSLNINRIDNNMVLRKIRIAFELKDVDVVALLKKSKFNITTGELGAMARNRDHAKYMLCGDQFLRYLLRGLALTYRPEIVDSNSTEKKL